MAPQREWLALGVVSLLVAVAVGSRLTRESPEPPDWAATEEAVLLDQQTQRAEAETGRQRRRNTPLTSGERIDPNRATADELQRLPRVGPAVAGRIVAHREAHGAFRTLADLDAVSGIGPAMLAAIAPHVTLPPAVPTSQVVPAPAKALAAPPAPGPINLNAATPAELQALPGIGPALAGRIVQWRGDHGNFRTVDDLQNVPGIGPKTLDRLRPLIRVSP